MPVKVENFQSLLVRELAPAWLLGGPEPLILQECRDSLFRAARAAGYTERETVHIDARFDWESLEQLAAEPSLFAQKKILDLRLPTGKAGKDGSAALLKWLRQPPADTLLVLSCDVWDTESRKSKWAEEYDRLGVRVDIWPIKASQLPRWIEDRLQRAGVSADREAVRVLADRLEGNLLALQQEINKLALQSPSSRLGAREVLDSVADDTRFDAWLLCERIMEGNLADGLRVVAGLRRSDFPLPILTGALVRELGQLESVRAALQSGESESAIFSRLRIWQARQPPLQAALRRISPRQLAEAFRSLERLDLQSKGQAAGNPWHTLDQLVASLCSTRQ